LKNELKLEVAQNRVSVVLSDPLFSAHVAQSYRGFLSNGDPKAVIEAHIVDTFPQKRSDGPPVAFTGRGMSISDTSFEGTIDLLKGSGNLYTMPKSFAFALKVLLRYLFIFIHLRDGDGLVLHALGVLKDGEAYVFFGPSGSGKTTAAHLSNGCTILSDELVFVQLAQESFWVHPTPPWGDIQRGKRENRPYPLKAVFKLIKADDIGMKQSNPAQGIADVTTFPHLPRDLIGPDRLLERFTQLVKRVPFYELHFTRDRSFWPCIDGGLG
jgi:hypothetical protein